MVVTCEAEVSRNGIVLMSFPFYTVLIIQYVARCHYCTQNMYTARCHYCTLLLYSQSLQDFAILRSLNLFNYNFRKSSRIYIIAANFLQKDVNHSDVQSVKERLFLSLKNGMKSLAFSSCPIYKSYIGQINRKQNKSALLVWAPWRRPFICSARSRGLLLITR